LAIAGIPVKLGVLLLKLWKVIAIRVVAILTGLKKYIFNSPDKFPADAYEQ
jgi:hypothetical protein